jgi:undecaprenyl-diphosphatase
MRRARPALPVHHALLLGLVQGPSELLPVSSSAHTTLIPVLAGWPYQTLEPRLRKSFELALHGGGALALALHMRSSRQASAAPREPGQRALVALAVAPAACAGLVFQGPIERRLGSPRAIAAGLLAGALAMLAAERKPGGRSRNEARAADGLALGIAQSVALIPGVSRSGATLAAARLRGFARADAEQLSWRVGLPLMLGAALARLAVIARAPLAPGAARALGAGAGAAFCSTLAAARLLGLGRGRRLAPYAVYRCLLAALVIRRVRGGRNGGPLSIDR